MIFGISYILVGILVLILAARFSDYEPGYPETMPPIVIVLIWPTAVVIGILSGLIYGVECLHELSCTFVQKCKKDSKQPTPREKIQS